MLSDLFLTFNDLFDLYNEVQIDRLGAALLFDKDRALGDFLDHAAVLIAVCLVPDVRLDHLFPLHGEGDAAILAALKAGVSLAWPVVLLLTMQPTRMGRLRSAVLPAFAAVAALLVLTLTIPSASRDALTASICALATG